jgi:DNA-binding MarR family transcriptional regulator
MGGARARAAFDENRLTAPERSPRAGSSAGSRKGDTQSPSRDTVVEQMRSLTRSVQSLMADCARAAKLNQSDYMALLRLVAADGLTGAQLGRALGMTGSSISELADRLERERLIARRRPRQDRRLVMLSPTARGQRLIEQTLGPVLARTGEIVDALDPLELATVWHFLQNIAAGLDAARPSERARR